MLLLLLLSAAVAVAVAGWWVLVAGASLLELMLPSQSLMKIWPDGSKTEPILGQLGIGLEVGGRDHPPGGWIEVGDRDKGAFWVASQKQQNHYFCCTKLQISGLNVTSTKYNNDCETTKTVRIHRGFVLNLEIDAL